MPTDSWKADDCSFGELTLALAPVVSSFSYDNENRLTRFSVGGGRFCADATSDSARRCFQ